MRFTLIQVFRGVAAMLVVMHHLIANSTNHLNYVTYGNFFNFGFVGVDFFFVLSGFIITYIHFPDLIENKKNQLSIFFKKRLLRIYPIYWFVALITVVIYYVSTPIFMKEAGLTIDLTSWKSIKFLVESFLLIYNEDVRLVGVAWTLSYELLFYFIFGIGILLKFKASKIAAGIWLILIVLFSIFKPFDNEFFRFFFNVVIIEFLFGCLIAYLIRKKVHISFKYTIPLTLIILAVMISTFKIEGLVFKRDLINVTLMSVFFALITYMAVKFDQKNTSIKFPWILILIGDASYSIYLTHNIFLSALTRIYAKLNTDYLSTGYLALVCTMIFIITVIVGIVVHLIIEKKLLNFLNRKFNLQKMPLQS